MTENPYETSAEVSKITGRKSIFGAPLYHGKDDFIFHHERFDHPDIILCDNISLYTITAEEAVFVDCGDFDVFSNKVIYIEVSQREKSLKIITLPIKSFHLIASQIQIPNAPLLHIANHSRCGSTLTYKMFQSIPKTHSISEPYSLVALADYSRTGCLTQEELRKMCISIIKCTIKHANVRESELICIMAWSRTIFIVDVLFEAWPAMKHVYLYRQPVSFVRSWEKLQILNKWPELEVEQIKIRSGIGKNKIMLEYPILTDDYLRKLSRFGSLGIHWITCNAAYNSILKKGYPIASIKFEDLLDQPEEMVMKLFKYFEIPLDKFPDVNEILKIDSQAGTFLTSKIEDEEELKKSLSPITDVIREEMNELCELFNLPSFWDTNIYFGKKIQDVIQD